MTKRHPASNEQKAARQEQESIHARHRPDELPPDVRGPAGSGGGDIHAAGAPLGGSAVGGLGGTNVGDGDPENADIDAAGGGGNFDPSLEADEEPGYSGQSGGAVGGTPANKRASGGHVPHQVAPHLGREHDRARPKIAQVTRPSPKEK
jgi:hypothetical protein